jgi:gliding motility-associated-like protein
LLVPAAYDTVLSGTNTILNVSLIGTPPYNISVFDGNQLYSYVVNGNSQSITLTPFQNPTTYTLTSISDASGCPYSGVSQSVTIYTYINSTVYAGTDTAICGLVGTLNATPSVSGINWWTGPSWVTFSDTTSPTSQITSTLYLNAQIWWHEQNGSFHNSASIHVKFDEMVSPPDAGVDITLLGLNSVSLNAGIPVPALSTGLWSVIAGNAVFNNTGDSHTQVSSLLNGENILVWTVRNGACGPLSDTMSIFVKDMIIPEGFSPNNDGKNDYFEITGIETFDKSELIVFNRWGHMVYQKSNYDNSWNGKGLNDKPLAEDTYFYLLTLNNKETKKGFIVLKR